MAEPSDQRPPVLSYATPSTSGPRDHTRWGDICLAGSVLLLVASVMLSLTRGSRVLTITLSGTAALAVAAGAARVLTPRSRAPLRAWGFGYPLWLCVFLAVVPVGAFLYAASQPRVRAPSTQMRCLSNLWQIRQACVQYFCDYGSVFPDRLERILTMQGVSSVVFCCPESTDKPAAGATTQAMIADFQKPGRCSYIYVGAGIKEPINPDAVVAYEPLSNHSGSGVNVLFAGHVEFISASDAQYILSELAAGHNPPRKRGADGTPMGP